MRPIFGMSISQKQQKYIDTDEDEHDQVFNDLPRQNTNEDDQDEDEEEYGDQFEREDIEEEEEEIDEGFEKYK